MQKRVLKDQLKMNHARHVTSGLIEQPPLQTEILDERQVSRYYGLSKPWLRKARREGRGPRFLRIGQRMIRYRRQDIEEFLADCTVSQGARRG